MFDKTSDEFITNFSQTGVDEGPQNLAAAAVEKTEAPKPAPKIAPKAEVEADGQPESELARQVREKSLRAREERERSENAPAFRGFAALLQSANTAGAFSRALDEPPADPANAADGNVIKVKDTVGKKRGLYTSCFKKPVFPDELPETKPENSENSATPANEDNKPADNAVSKWAAQAKANPTPQQESAPAAKAPPAPDYSAFSRSSMFVPEPEAVPVEPSFEKPNVPTQDIVKSAGRPALEISAPVIENLDTCANSCQSDRKGGAFTRALKKLPESESAPGSKSAWAEEVARKQRQDATDKDFKSLRGCNEANDSCCPLTGALSKVFNFFGNLFKGGKK